nr:MAG TPA_asm: hypothetical protein [Caudoviricetes sp.]
MCPEDAGLLRPKKGAGRCIRIWDHGMMILYLLTGSVPCLVRYR